MLNAVYSRATQYFLKVSETKNISKAAKLLHISQSTVSVAIKQLEDDLGFQLFVRNKGKGQLLLTRRAEELERLLRAQSDLLNEQIQAPPERLKPLKIAAIPYFSRKFLLPSLKELGLLKGANIYHVRGGAAEKAVKEGQVDVAFFSSKSRPLRSSKLCIPIRKEKVGVVGLKKRFHHIEAAQSLNELEDEPWVIGDRPREDWFNSLDGRTGCFWVDDHFSARSLVLEGYGIAPFQLDYFSENELNKLSISRVKIPSEGLKLYAVVAKGLNGEQLQQVERLMAHLKEKAGN